MKDHTVAIAYAFDVGGEVKTDGPVANGIHGLGVEEVVGPRWRGWRQNPMSAESNKQHHNRPDVENSTATQVNLCLTITMWGTSQDSENSIILSLLKAADKKKKIEMWNK